MIKQASFDIPLLFFSMKRFLSINKMGVIVSFSVMTHDNSSEPTNGNSLSC
jgi:hypothetical protein